MGSLEGYYRFKLKNRRRKRLISDYDYKIFENQIKTNSSVKWIERQKLLVRRKRDLITEQEHRKGDATSINEIYNDPLWPQMWFLNRESINNLPDMNVTGAWSMGYSGKGVSVTFLDDGIERDHPDLMKNYDPKASYDLNDNDKDPMPRYDPMNRNKFVIFVKLNIKNLLFYFYNIFKGMVQDVQVKLLLLQIIVFALSVLHIILMLEGLGC